MALRSGSGWPIWRARWAASRRSARARSGRFLQQRFLGRPAAEDSLLIARVAIALGDEAEARAALGWVEAEVPAADRTPQAQLFTRLVTAWLDRAPAATWTALLDDAGAAMAPDDRLEVMYWTARAAGRSPSDPDLGHVAERARREASTWLEEVPIWRYRFENL